MIKQKFIKPVTHALGLTILLLISSCGGGGGDDSKDSPLDVLTEGFLLSPADLNLNTVSSNTISAAGVKTFKFKTLTTGDYTISLTDLSSDMGFELYSYDPADTTYADIFDNLIDDTNGDLYDDTTDEVYTFTNLPSDTFYYIVIDEWDDVSGSYTLQVLN